MIDAGQQMVGGGVGFGVAIVVVNQPKLTIATTRPWTKPKHKTQHTCLSHDPGRALAASQSKPPCPKRLQKGMGASHAEWAPALPLHSRAGLVGGGTSTGAALLLKGRDSWPRAPVSASSVMSPSIADCSWRSMARVVSRGPGVWGWGLGC